MKPLPRFLIDILPIAFWVLVVITPILALTDDRLPTSRDEIHLSFAPLVKKVAPTVVNIYTKRVVQQRQSPFANDPLFRHFFDEGFFGFRVPKKRVQNSLGSGVIVKPEGVVVTNHHVIDKADQITVVLSDRRELDAKLILSDKKTDLAILRVQQTGEPLPFIKLSDSDELEVGDLVLAIGNPFGVGQTVTSGIVSALARAAEGISDFSFFIQTDAAINPGNSGGALVSMDGRLIGINTAIFSKSGGSMGIGFAIPANMVAKVVDSASYGTKIVRPWFGAGAQAVTSAIAASMGLRRPIGVLISELYVAGPADRAGLRVGDIIVALNGREVANPKALRFRIATLTVGEKVPLSIIRQGKPLSLQFPIEPPPEIPLRNITNISGRHFLAGATVANLSPALAEELSIDFMYRGVIVLGVDRRSPARRRGLRPGDIIVRLNGRVIDRIKSLRSIIDQGAAQWTISVRRAGELLTAKIDG